MEKMDSTNLPNHSESPLSLCDMSPMSNLAVNLYALTTSVAGTPMRRISWSNPIPGGDKIGLNPEDFSPAQINSPTFQPTSLSKVNNKPKLRRKKLIIDSEDDKENLTPKARKSTCPMPLLISHNSAPDSGYSSSSVPQHKNLFSANKNGMILSCDDDDSMDSIFQFGNSQEEVLAVPNDMESLLTNPLFNNDKSENPTPIMRRGKLPIRRCLSMETDHDTIPHKKLSMTNLPFKQISSPVFSNDDVEATTTMTKSHFKRPEPPTNYYMSSQNKRRKSSPNIIAPDNASFRMHRSYSETATTIMHAILKSDLQPELIGDGSRNYALPMVKGRHQDLRSITSHTLASLLSGEYKDIESYTLVDCRYPYEYEGGHIQGAVNIFTKEDVLERFLSESADTTTKNVVIFHCEFSSERAPALYRYLRSKDREMNDGNYPRLNHPEVYILEGGYKAFFESFKELCDPQGYKPMKHKDHGFEMRHFRAKSKSCGSDYKGRALLRTNSKNSIS